ncbi:apicoplast pyruvate carrier 1-like isoform X1 [Tachypleus tridentatus]|uniref:apicoplast pyruvate carrier 1-like isoform X1 n=1 Tax=Tachypleus tridentatus TaxID=6853 RepID=UPI003FD11627
MKARSFVAVSGCFLIYVGLGLIHLFGNIIPYLTSYLRERVDRNTTYEQTAWLFYTTECISSSFFCGVWLAQRIGHRSSILIGTVIYSFGMAATYWTIKHSLEATIASLAVVTNIGFDCCYSFPLAAAMVWFPNNKGLMAGIVSSGMASAPLLMNNLHTYFINPDNLQPDADGYFHDPGILDRVPTLFLIMGAVQGGILLVGLLLYQEPPSETLEEREDYSVIPVENSSNHKVEETEHSFPKELGVTPKEALKMYEFYILLVMFIGSLHSSLFVNNFYKTYGQTFIDDDIFLATTGSVSSIVHVVLRVVMGLIQDKISFKLTSLILMGLKTVLLFTLIVTPYGGRVMFIMWICGLFATFPVEFVCIPAAIAEVFGNKHTAMIYGVIYFVVGTSVVVWPLIIQITFPYFGWFATFCLIGSISFIGFLASMVYPENFHRQPAKSTICNDEREQVLYGTVVWQK